MIDRVEDAPKQLSLLPDFGTLQRIDSMSVEELRREITQGLLAHLADIGLVHNQTVPESTGKTKEDIREYHAAQRNARQERNRTLLERNGPALLRYFAEGAEINPVAVQPILRLVRSDTVESTLFRVATLLWSVPVSNGYGRRMRYLVFDGSNNKLMGLFALTDPVFNLRARDNWIGWNAEDRRRRLVNVMDAYVLGAVPPYSQLLGGKVVAAMMAAREVCDTFAERYSATEGIISKERKHANLALITVTSALGRSSLYNRLYLPDVVRFHHIGFTQGWGHFQVPDMLFLQMRRLLALRGHKYAHNGAGGNTSAYNFARGHVFGQGPNWRIRVVREALKELGLDQDLLRHGIEREVFAAPLAPDWQDFLRGNTDTCRIERPTAAEVGQHAVSRWMAPRAQRMPGYADWTREHTAQLLAGNTFV